MTPCVGEQFGAAQWVATAKTLLSSSRKKDLLRLVELMPYLNSDSDSDSAEGGAYNKIVSHLYAITGQLAYDADHQLMFQPFGLSQYHYVHSLVDVVFQSPRACARPPHSAPS